MSKKIIEFAKPSTNAPDPLDNRELLENKWSSRVLKPEHAKRKHKFRSGDSWLRILPPLQGSAFQWMLRAEILTPPEGNAVFTEFVHPKTFDASARSPFDEAYRWFLKNAKEKLYNKDRNATGFRLRTKPIGISYIIDTSAEEGERLKVFVSSLYDGQWGGAPGLACKIWQTAHQVDTEPDSQTQGQLVYGDITDPETGRLVLVSMQKPETGSKYASYTVRIGKKQSKLAPFLESLTDEEHDLLVPLENIIERLTYEEQLDILKSYIGKQWFDKIFTNQTEAQEAPEAPKEPEAPEEPEAPKEP